MNEPKPRHEVMQGEDLWTTFGHGRVGFQHLSGVRMQFAAPSVGEARVRDFTKERVTKPQLVIRLNDEPV